MISRIRYLNALILSAGTLLASMAVFAEPTSVYTDLRGQSCKLISQDEFGSSVSRCAGINGYQLLALGGDIRESITIVDPKGKQHPLKFWEVITYTPSRLGDKAEWRVIQQNGKAIPQALIVRLVTTPYDETTGGNTRR
jgi:hypothetical protein